MKHNLLISLAALLCISLPFSCSSDIALPPPPESLNPSSDNLSSSSAQTWNNNSSSSLGSGDVSSTSSERGDDSSSSGQQENSSSSLLGGTSSSRTTSSSSTTSSNNSSSSVSSSGECQVKALLEIYCPPGTAWPDGIKWNQLPTNGVVTSACYYVTSISMFDMNNWNQTLFKINGQTITTQVNNNHVGNFTKVDNGYYIYYDNSSQYNSASIGMTSGKPACAPSGPSGPATDEDTYCSGATKIVGFNASNNASAATTNAVCFKITGNINSGWSASNANGRICRVNNGAEVKSQGTMIENQPAASAKNGYVYINCSAGNEAYFNITIW